MRTLAVDFYKITDSEESPIDLSNLLARAENDEPLTYHWGGDFYKFDSIRRAGVVWTGEITRVLPELPVTRGDSTGQADVIPCGANEGPWWKAVFLHHPATCSVLVERSRSCGPASAFKKFVESLGDLDAIALQPLLEKKKWQRLAKIDEVTKFEIKVAGLSNPALLKQAGSSATAIAEFMELIESPSIQLNASIGRGRGYRKLNAERVKRAAKKLFNLSVDAAPEITKIEVGGRVGLEETDVIDLIKGRIFESATFEPGADKTISFEDRLDFIRSAWEMRREEVTELYLDASS